MGASEETNPTLKEQNANSSFVPIVPEHALFSDIPDELWQPMLHSQCEFEPEMFLKVMHNLIKNPNIMSTHLFRADILYDSQKDHTIVTEPGDVDFSDFTKHMKKDCRPVYVPLPGYQWQQTYVRTLVPRNRQLDRDLIQTCHFYTKQCQNTFTNLIIYIPHVSSSAEMPWYHPKVKQVAFLHESPSTGCHKDTSGTVSVHFCQFPDFPLDQRLERTALQLLSKIHKHSQGQQAGYVKRVHHDQIIPQQRFQETYARLKAKYAKKIIDGWVEDTDPSKHVFEDLGIAAFLIELWADMYDCGSSVAANQDKPTVKPETRKPKFPGFVDIGCGNGLLINLLNLEGYAGWGFDARRRKTWQTFSPEVRDGVKEMVLVPEVFQDGEDADDDANSTDGRDDLLSDRAFHSGMFSPIHDDVGSPPPFIISNHADELTPWTPLIAYMNGTSFIAIPCCSHNLAGARFRAPAFKAAAKGTERVEETPSEQDQTLKLETMRANQAAETGSLKKSATAKKLPSAYASLCDYVSSLADEVGFTVEKEMLRIPSTRNACVLGRFSNQKAPTSTYPDSHSIPDMNVDQAMSTLSLTTDTKSVAIKTKQDHVREIVARELNTRIDIVRKDWIARARQIAGKKGEGH